MREKLRDWLGEYVYFHGRVIEWKKLGDMNHVLYKPAYAHVFDTSLTGDELKERAIKFDHLWLQQSTSNNETKGIEMWSKNTLVGKVYEYVRSDGSHDFSIKVKSVLDYSIINEFICDLCNSESYEMARTFLEKVLETVDEGTVLYCVNKSHNDALHSLSELSKTLKSRRFRRNRVKIRPRHLHPSKTRGFM